MDLIQSIWLSSAAGAGLFFGAGLLVSKAFPSKGGDGANAGLLLAEKEARQHAEARAAALEQQQAALAQSLEGERSRAQEAQNARAEAQKLRDQISQLEADLNRARAAASGPSAAETQLRQESADLRQRLAAAEQASQGYAAERARTQDLEQRLASAVAQAGAAHGNEAQKQDLERRLAAAQSEVHAAQTQLRDAKAQVDQLRAGAQRAEQLAADNAQLRSRQTGSDKLAAELATEKAKVTQLQSQIAALQKTAENTGKLTADLAAEKAKVTQLQSQIAALQKTAENTGKLAADLTAEKTKVRELEQRLAAAQKSPGDSGKLAQELAAEKAKVQQLQAQTATLQQAANEAARLGFELASARTKVNDLESRLARAPVAGANTQEAERLRTSNISLQGELDILKRTAIAQKDYDALKKTNNDMALRMRTLEQRASETDYYANENSDLRRRLEELEAIALEAKQMRRRITDLEAQAFAMAAAKTKDKGAVGKTPAAQATATASGSERRLEEMLEEAMSMLIREETGGRAVVLSDTRGLLLASAGEPKYQNELAAAASVVAEVAEKVRALLPFAEPQTLHLSDVNNVIVKTRWLRLEDDTLALSVLGFSEDMPDPTEDKVVKTVSKLMAYG